MHLRRRCPTRHSLKAAAADRGKLIGIAVQASFLGNPLYNTVVDREFNYLTAEYEMKWSSIEPVAGASMFGAGDAIVEYARSRRRQVRSHLRAVARFAREGSSHRRRRPADAHFREQPSVGCEHRREHAAPGEPRSCRAHQRNGRADRTSRNRRTTVCSTHCWDAEREGRAATDASQRQRPEAPA
jgi:hypothetical protein